MNAETAFYRNKKSVAFCCAFFSATKSRILKIVWFISLLFLSIIGFSQKNVKIFAEKERGITILFAENNEICPVSVLLTLELFNMTANGINDNGYIIPAKAGKIKLIELRRIERGKKTTYSYTFSAIYGNVNLVTYDSNYLYDLPYRKGLQFRIEQGYNGSFTHQNEKALDFNMPEGTLIQAAREGVVAAVVQNNNETCLREECKKMSNYVLIFHSDGSFAEYAHIQYNGAFVAVGDTVTKGMVIAISGSTGYARGPHLHFVCFLPDFVKRRTVATKFRTGKGTHSAYLAENKTYKKNYQ